MIFFRPIILVLMSLGEGLRGLSDEALMLRYAAGEDPAFEILYKRHRVRVLHYIKGGIGNHQVANELTQETFERVFKAASRYTNSAKFSTWIIQIAKNLRTDHLRKKRPGKTAASRSKKNPDDMPADQTSPDQAAMRKQQASLVLEASTTLPIKQQEVFRLKNMGHSFREIGEILEISVNTAKSRYNYALKGIKLELDRYRRS